MLFTNMTWMDVEHYLDHHDDRVIVITGACEQHAYLSLLTDINAPLDFALAATQEEPVPIAPPLNFGVSPYFAAYPGTISLRPETFTAVMRDVLAALLAQGFRRILVSNGHGGNTDSLRNLLIDLNSTHEDARIRLFEWWKLPVISEIAADAGLTPNHANWLENLPGTRVGDVPDEVKAAVDLPVGASARDYRQALGDGSFGGAYQAPEDVTARLLNAVTQALIETLRGL